MKWLNNNYSNLSNPPSDKSAPHSFEGLTPHIEEEETHLNDVTTIALEEALTSRDIKNIAITGSFGAGKSSFLRSFELYHPEWNCLFISLASFKDRKNSEEANQLIERSILQQLFYKVSKKEIPFSRFKRIHHFHFSDYWLPISSFIIWITSFLIIFHPDIAKKFLYFNDLNLPAICGEATWFCNTTVLISFVITSVIIIWKIYKYFANFKITKLSTKGGIEASETSKESILNEHIDEILYFFEVTPYNVIVIEDLDRDNNQEIFVKIREINQIINNSDQVKGVVNFVYAIKDDMFVDETRTKFFDFMVPIIPYLSRSNSYAKLKNKFAGTLKDSSENSKNEFERLLKIISQYISDMRLLINILNEFKIYSQTLMHTENYTKLLAMITYKNMLPYDFSKTHHNESYLAIVFAKKEQYILLAIAENKIAIQEIKEKLDEHNSKKEWLSDQDELKKLYIFEAFKESNNKTFHVNNEQININTFDIKQTFNWIIETGVIKAANNHTILFNSFAELEKGVHKHTYAQREAIITGEAENYSQELKEQIESLEIKNTEIRNYTIKDLLTIEVVSNQFKKELSSDKENSDDNTKSSMQLLRFLVREGYIDKHYHTYISHFHDGDLTEQDNRLINAIRDLDKNLTHEALHEPLKVIDELDPQDFNHSAILNLSLIDALVIRDNSDNKLSISLKLLSSSDSSAFIEEYLDSHDAKNKGKFIQLLAANDRSFWKNILANDTSAKKLDEYFALLVHALDVDTLVNQNESNTFKNHIENKTDFIEYCTLNSFDRTKIEMLLRRLKVKFYDIELIPNNEFSDIIYYQQMYVLNPKMINKVIGSFSDIAVTAELKGKLKKSHYTTLKTEIYPSEGMEELSVYIYEETADYVNRTLIPLEGNTEESEENIIELLNHEGIDDIICEELIQKTDFKVIIISEVIHKPLWPILFEHNKVVASWDNILHFYQYQLNKEKEESKDE